MLWMGIFFNIKLNNNIGVIVSKCVYTPHISLINHNISLINYNKYLS